jgi:hypothetical protein
LAERVALVVDAVDVPEVDDPELEEDELPLHMPLPVVDPLPVVVVVGVVVVTAAGKNPVPELAVEFWVSSWESKD